MLWHLKNRRQLKRYYHTQTRMSITHDKVKVSVQNAGFMHKTVKGPDAFNILTYPAPLLMQVMFSPMCTCLEYNLILYAMDTMCSTL